MNTINLYGVFLHRAIAGRAGPAESGSIGSNASKRYVGGFRDIDPEDIDEVGDRFP